MNIYITALTYYPHKDGVQMVTQYMAEGLAKRGHNVIVITRLKEGLKREEVHNGVRIVRYVIKTKLKFDFGEKKEFQNYLLKNRNEIDALVTVCANAAFAKWTYPIVDQLKCKKVMYQHGMYDGRLQLEQVHSFNRLAKQLLLTPYWEAYHRHYWGQIMKYDACVHLFPQDSSYRYFKEHGFENNIAIMNSCQKELFEPLSKKELYVLDKYDIRAPYFIYVGNYCSRKNQKLALRSFYEMENSKAELVLIGSAENEYVKELRELKQCLDEQYPLHGKVHVLTNVSREDTISLIKRSYACVMSSNNEYMPLTIIESMACGKPYISTNVGIVPQLPGGVVVSKKEYLSYWMSYYLEHPSYVETMGLIAKEYALEYMCLEDKVSQLEEVLMQ